MKKANLDLRIAGNELMTIIINNHVFMDIDGLPTKSYDNAVKFHNRNDAKAFIDMKLNGPKVSEVYKQYI